MAVPYPDEEMLRVEALHRYGVVGRAPEQVYDDLTLLAAKVLQTPIAGMGFIAEDHEWFKSSYGVALPSVAREDAICSFTVANPMEATVVPDTYLDARLEYSPFVRNAPFVRSYAGAPLLTPDFRAVGTLCVMDTRPRHFTPDQLELLRTLARQAVSQLELRRQTVLLTNANDKLQMLATGDGLTGLKNHRAFQEQIEDEVDFAVRNSLPLSLVLLDVDKFKAYNDEFGHPAGDEILRAVAILLLGSSREYDFVARYGGEEFAIILRGAGAAEAFAMAERLRHTIAGANWPRRKVTASLGVASLSPGVNTRSALIAEADRLLYEAKQRGRNRVARAGAADADGFDPAQWDAVTQALTPPQ